MQQLTIFFDGNCPLCAREISALRVRDSQQRITFENIYADDFARRYPAIDIIKADRILHGQLADGTMIYGLDVTAKAWRLADAHGWIQILRWPVIRWFTDICYRLFSGLRHPVGRLMGREATCDTDKCER
ncbi:MAG: DUF393 domain-containing protein [Methylophaga sp.]|nr:DUF393 domain-containing protein [Methylophaga sp.]